MTDNHDYDTPGQGEEDWHVPLNENFEELDVDVEVRDVADNRDGYEPNDGAKFLETDTGVVYEGDGDSWVPALAMAVYDEDGNLDMGELASDGASRGTVIFETDDLSRAIGNGARAVHQGAVVIGDSRNTQFWSKGPDEVRSQIPMYAPAFNTTSASAAKTDVSSVDPTRALEGVESLEINTWTFTDVDTGRHMGPMAEDFHRAFGLSGGDESIASVDADGVAFAAIQGLLDRLNDERDRLDEENERLRAELEEATGRIDRMESENDELRRRLAEIEDALDGTSGPQGARVRGDD